MKAQNWISRSLTLFLLLSFSHSLSLPSSAASPSLRDGRPEKISITSRADKTAVWTGDLLNYTVQLFYDPDVEFVKDYLNPEKLSLNPFVIRSLSFEERPSGGKKKTLQITFLLSTYETGKNEVIIPAFTLFYFRQDAGFKRPEPQESIAQTIRVPAFPVGLRSTLSGTQLKFRDYKPVIRTDRRIALSALTLGLIGMICAAGIGARNTRRFFRSERKSAAKKVSRRSEKKLAQRRLATIQALSHGSEEELQRFYAETEQFVRETLRRRLNTETSGWTADEIEKVLKDTPSLSSVAPEIKAVLDDCDRVRYGRDGLRIAAERASQVSKGLEKIVRTA